MVSIPNITEGGEGCDEKHHQVVCVSDTQGYAELWDGRSHEQNGLQTNYEADKETGGKVMSAWLEKLVYNILKKAHSKK